ncbi:MAG: GyrI-like domain-containing protein [Planctomycetes bacterium]|nr:GyrI-like domain-containing protein [Planctomycetota bacterium]
MKKILLILSILAILAFGVSIGCKGDAEVQTQPDENAVTPDAENGQTDAELPNIEVEIKEIKPFKYVCVESTGSFDKIQTVIGTLWTEVGKRQIRPAGMMFGIYYSNPNTTAEKDCKWEIGIPVVADVKINEPLKLKDWTHTKIASYVYTGSYDKAGAMYPALYAKIAKMGFVPVGPSRSIYLNDPNMVKPEEIKTELTVPVAKPEK